MNAVRFLPRRFQGAGLALELRAEPLAPQRTRGNGVEHIVQMDIARSPSERFQIYPGAKDNRVEVLGVDRPHQQLVLFVHEPARAFTVSVPKRASLSPGAKVVRETSTLRFVEHTTEARKRHFLFGMDEQHLFMAELPHGVSSVHGARESLRAPEVPPNLRSRDGRVIRQGEWFFLPVKAQDSAELGSAVERKLVMRDVGIAQAARLDRAGRPHVASEVVVVQPYPTRARSMDPSLPKIFVRGDVRHPDHRTVHFRDWRRVVPNRERFDRREGMLWVD